MSEILILNGRLIDPANRVDAPRDLLLRDGRVAAVETPGAFGGCRQPRPSTQPAWSWRRV